MRHGHAPRRLKLAWQLGAACILLLTVTNGLLAQDPSPENRPNVVLVVVDDAAFTDFGVYGSEIRTPTIDALANRGTVFSNFHASPMCSPSRAMLLTGVDAHLAGVGSLRVATPLRHRGEPGYAGELRTDVLTLATRLREVGYRTYLSGKWNLGHGPTSLPSARGFDRTFALDATGADNFEKKSYLPIYDDVPWFADGKPTELPDDFYSSEHLVDRMIGFIQTDGPGSVEKAQPESQLDNSASAGRPFFGYLAFQAIHMPVQAPREFIQRYEGVYRGGWEALRRSRIEGAVRAGVFPETAEPSQIPEQADWESLSAEEQALAAKSMAVNAAMLEAMDFHLGRLVDYLRERGLFENTIFVVLSDNGPEAGDPARSRSFARWAEEVGYRRDLETLGEKGSYAFIGPDFARATAGPLSYYKFHGGEGGLRVPLVMAGPGVLGRGVTNAFAYITDVAPTILELTGTSTATPADITAISGRSMAPLLAGSESLVHPPDEPVSLETAGHSAVFKGPYKLVRVGTPQGDRQWRLFNLNDDPGETQDLSSAQPALVAELLADYETYAQHVGALEVPWLYSPTRQLIINFLFDRSKEKLMKPRTLIRIALVLATLVLLVWFGLPRFLTALGLHPHYAIPPMDLSGHRALIVTTSHDKLIDEAGESSKPTGVFASEMTIPYYAFREAGLEVDIASVQGGAIPVDPMSVRWPAATSADRRFLRDEELRGKVERSLAIENVNASDYDIVFLAGGWGAAYDLGQSQSLGDQVSEAWAQNAIVGGVCHGPLGLLNAKDETGEPLVKGRRLTAVTDKQIEELKITFTPMHPERDLRAAGARFEAASRFRDFLATSVVVDGRLVTGQNQNSGAETAHRMMEAVLARDR